MISEKLTSMLLPTHEEYDEAILAFLRKQPATEEELAPALQAFTREVVKARFTLAMVDNLKSANVTLTLDGDKLRWHAAEEGKSRGTDRGLRQEEDSNVNP